MYINNGRINYDNQYGYRRGVYREPFYSDASAKPLTKSHNSKINPLKRAK